MILPISVGVFSMAVLNLNNLRDIHTDAAVGKRTLVVKLGMPWAKGYHVTLLVTGMITALVYNLLQHEEIKATSS